MNLRYTSLAAVILAAGLLGPVATTHADENMFGYVYGADTLPKGKFELYNWTTWRHDKNQGEYDAFDVQFELEYGITDRFQTSTYLVFDGRDQSGLGSHGLEDISDFRFDGLKQAFKYNVLSTYKDPIGLSLYFEPGYSRFHKVTGERLDEFEIETKLILQKNFLDDTLLWALNVTPEFEWYFPDGESSETEFILELSSGLSYRVAKNWFVGVETRYHTEFPEYGAQEHQAIFLGPNIHYGGKKWWFTLTWLPQIWGEPNENGSSLHFGEHERSEVRLKVGFNF
ncbi:MAG: hypothetical protein KA004_01970 [Verrucomicrobiales bacterium]|nr:hypothetical protein [Verrucomicrobiales bacterium]